MDIKTINTVNKSGINNIRINLKSGQVKSIDIEFGNGKQSNIECGEDHANAGSINLNFPRQNVETIVEASLQFAERLGDGRNYLMSVSPKDLTVEDCLKAFGWKSNGIGLLE